MPVTYTLYKTHNGTKHLSVIAKKKTGGEFSLLVQEFTGGGTIYWMQKNRYYKGRQTSSETINFQHFDTFSEAVRCGRTHILNLIGGK